MLPAEWLRTYREVTPRSERQDLIDRLELGRFLRGLKQEPAALRATRYPLVLYVLSARTLRDPVAFGRAEREAHLRRVATLFGLPAPAVLRDVHAMMRQLRHDHRAWLCRLRRKENAPAPDSTVGLRSRSDERRP